MFHSLRKHYESLARPYHTALHRRHPIRVRVHGLDAPGLDPHQTPAPSA